MSANGAIAFAANAAGQTAGFGLGQTTGKTASSAGFAGVLVQALVGTDASGASASGTPLPAGLLGLLSLPGLQASDPANSGLSQLLADLTEQLNALDPNAELPAGLQDQLAALLLLLQNFLQQTAASAPEEEQNGGIAQAAAGNAWQALFADAGLSLPVAQTLRQALQQLAKRITGGEIVPAQTTALAEPLQKALNALQKYADSPAASAASANRPSRDLSGSANAAPPDGAFGQAAGPKEDARDVPAEFKRVQALPRNPVWHVPAQAASDSSAAGAASGLQGTESAEAPLQSGSVPVWSLLQGDRTPAKSASLPNAPAPVPVRQFADEIGKYLVKQFVLTQGNGSSEARISLHPEHLGQVDIKILLHNGQLTAQFVTESGVARDLLENQMAQLRATLQGQGLQVEKMEVVQQPSSSAGASFFHQNPGHQGGGHQGGGSKGRGMRGAYDDSAGFEAELDRTAFLREIGYGSSLNVTA